MIRARSVRRLRFLPPRRHPPDQGRAEARLVPDTELGILYTV